MTARKALLIAALLSAGAFAAEVDPPPLALPTAPAAPRWLHKAANGTLELRSSSRGATVTLDGLELGTVPLKPVAVAPGKHELRVSKDGYQTATRTIVVRPSRKTVLSVELKSARVAPPPLALPTAPPSVASAAGPAGQAAGAPAGKAAGARAATAPGALVAEPEPSPSETLSAIIAAPPASGSAAPQAAADLPPPPLVLATPARKVPAAALAAAPQPVVSEQPLTKKWWFWGGAAVAAAALAAGVTYALPALYVERRDPAAACGGGACVVVNK